MHIIITTHTLFYCCIIYFYSVHASNKRNLNVILLTFHVTRY